MVRNHTGAETRVCPVWHMLISRTSVATARGAGLFLFGIFLNLQKNISLGSSRVFRKIANAPKKLPKIYYRVRSPRLRSFEYAKTLTTSSTNLNILLLVPTVVWLCLASVSPDTAPFREKIFSDKASPNSDRSNLLAIDLLFYYTRVTYLAAIFTSET
jgi:hypothetical protein